MGGGFIALAIYVDGGVNGVVIVVVVRSNVVAIEIGNLRRMERRLMEVLQSVVSSLSAVVVANGSILCLLYVVEDVDGMDDVLLLREKAFVVCDDWRRNPNENAVYRIIVLLFLLLLLLNEW